MTTTCTVTSIISIYAQLACAALIICTMMARWWVMQRTFRPFKQFIFDNLKQVASAGCAHFVAAWGSTVMGDLADGGSQCDWYLVIFVIDVLLGTLLSLRIMYFTFSLLDYPSGYQWRFLKNLGKYSFTNQRKKYLVQVLHWCLCVCIARLINVLLLWCAKGLLAPIVEYIGKQFHSDITEEWIVLFVFPIIIDTLQFVYQDMHLMGSKPLLDTMEDPMLREVLVHGDY